MITTVIFSRDRACQLDLLLRSIYTFAPGMVSHIHVLWRATDEEYLRGYEFVLADFPNINWRQEVDFNTDTKAILRNINGDLMMCMTDDSIFRRLVISWGMIPAAMDRSAETLCFSLRLGVNTTHCYPHNRGQELPTLFRTGDLCFWEWRHADGDFGYPASLDAHIFRSNEFREMIRGKSFSNPNQMEDALVSACKRMEKPLMACFNESSVVGLPVNRVNATHGNRFGGSELYSEKALNTRFLEGERLDLDALIEHEVDGAHAELPLSFR